MPGQVLKSLTPRLDISNFCYSKLHVSREVAEDIAKMVQDVSSQSDMSQFSNCQSFGNGSSVEEVPTKTKSAKRREQRKKSAEKKKNEQAGIGKSDEPSPVEVPCTSPEVNAESEDSSKKVHTSAPTVKSKETTPSVQNTPIPEAQIREWRPWSASEMAKFEELTVKKQEISQELTPVAVPVMATTPTTDQLFTLETLPTGKFTIRDPASVLATLHKILTEIRVPQYSEGFPVQEQKVAILKEIAFTQTLLGKSESQKEIIEIVEQIIKIAIYFLNTCRKHLSKQSQENASSKIQKDDEDSSNKGSAMVPCPSSEVETDGKVISKKVETGKRKINDSEPTVKSDKITPSVQNTPVPPKVAISGLCPYHLAQSTLLRSAPKKSENPVSSSLSPKNIKKSEPESKSKSPKTSEDLKMKPIAPEDSKSPEVWKQSPRFDSKRSEEAPKQSKSPEVLKQSPRSDSKKSEGVKCENEKCIKIKKLMLQKQNNRTIAEGELKKVDWKVKGFDKLKKEEEEWKVEKREMEKKIRALEKTITTMSSQADENKKLREENEKLKMDNERLQISKDKITKSHGRLETEYKVVLKEKREKTEELRKSNEAMSTLLKEKQALLEENQQLNGPLSSGKVSLEKKLQWHQNLQREFNPEEAVKRVRNMTEVLEKKTPEFQVLMEKEEKRLKFAIILYSRVLQYNLQLLEDTNSTVDLLPVPLLPKVSRRFEMKFEEEMRQRIPDTDIKKACFICLENFERGQIIVKCVANKHAVHKECGVQWSKVSGGTCGYCRSPMIVKN